MSHRLINALTRLNLEKSLYPYPPGVPIMPLVTNYA
jgi:hypothetical protein